MLATAGRRSQHVGAMRASLLSAHADGAYAASVNNVHHEKTFEVVLADSLLANARPDADSPCDASDPCILSRAPISLRLRVAGRDQDRDGFWNRRTGQGQGGNCKREFDH